MTITRCVTNNTTLCLKSVEWNRTLEWNIKMTLVEMKIKQYTNHMTITRCVTNNTTLCLKSVEWNIKMTLVEMKIEQHTNLLWDVKHHTPCSYKLLSYPLGTLLIPTQVWSSIMIKKPQLFMELLSIYF